MDIIDKLGRDRAKELEDFFVAACGDSDAVREIARNTEMHKFLLGKVTTNYPGYKPYTYKVARTLTTRQLHHSITLKQYLHESIITKEEHNTFTLMLESPDEADTNLLEMLLEVKYRPYWQKQRAKMKRAFKKHYGLK